MAVAAQKREHPMLIPQTMLTTDISVCVTWYLSNHGGTSVPVMAVYKATKCYPVGKLSRQV